jgi:glycosyltransferase involved in cell wall biosynthesis
VRVLHVIASGERRGAEVFASDLARELAEHGIDQRVAVLRSSGRQDVDFPVPLHPLEGGRGALPGLRLNVTRVRSLRARSRAWAPDVVQVHGGEALKYASVALFAQAPRIVYRRIGSAPSWISSGPRRVAYGRLMLRANRIVTVAEAVRRETIDLFRIPARRVVTIPNAVQVSRLEPVRGRDAVRRELGIALDAPVVLSLGALTWEKDPLAHLQIAGRALRELPDAVHLIAGDGPMRGDVEDRLRAGPLNGRVRLLGSRRDVGDLLAASDVLLFASRNDGMEGMPAVVIEAGMAGLPVAGYAVAGVPEVVDDGITGMLVTYGDVDALGDRLLALLEDEKLRREMGSAAAKRCRASFDVRKVASRYVELYREVVSEK